MRKRTHDEFIFDVREKSPNIIIIDRYTNGNSYVSVKCKKCGYTWNVIAKSLLRGHGCPKCARTLRKTHSEFVSEMSIINPQIEILGKYVNQKTKILCRCKIDGYVWEATPKRLLRGTGCNVCVQKYRGLKNSVHTHEDFIEKLSLKNPNVEVLEEYAGSKTKILCYCKVCGHKWSTAPVTLVREDNSGCPKCSLSKGELKIDEKLKAKGIVNTPQKTFNNLVGLNGGLLSYDFYLPKHNILIEYQGQYHDGTLAGTTTQTNEGFLKQQEHDRRKREYAKNNNIKLLEIWYWEFDKIEEILNKEIVNEESA